MQFQRKDYLVRIFQEMAEILASLIVMRQARQNERAMELVNRTVAGILGLTPELTDILAPQSLLALIDLDPLLDDNYRLMLAELLEAKAGILEDMQEPEEAEAIHDLAAQVRARTEAPSA